jgi:hypothetical protein
MTEEMIDRYVYQVGQRLPAERREDVARELASLIRDHVQDETGPAEASEAVVRRVLTEMGDPAAVAARYGYEPRLLIGVRSLPAFFRLAKVMPLAIAALFVLAFLLEILTGATNWHGALRPAALGWLLLSYLNSTLLNLGILVVVFAVLERLGRRRPAAVFDPAKLPRVPAPMEHERPRPAGLVIEIYLLAAVLALVNFRPDWFGPVYSLTWPIHVIPLSALGIRLPVPLFDIWIAALIVMKTEVLRQGTWTLKTRWVQLALTGLGVVVLGVTLLISRFGEISPSLELPAPVAAGLDRAGRALAFFLACLALYTLWKMGVAVRRLVHRPR